MIYLRQVVLILGLGLLLLQLTSCEDTVPLSGTISQVRESNHKPTVYLLRPAGFDALGHSYMSEVVDSARLEVSGRFAFENMPDDTVPRLYYLALQPADQPNATVLLDDIVTANYMPFVWQNGEQHRLTTTAAHFQRELRYTQTSLANEALQQLRDLRTTAYTEHLAAWADQEHNEDNLLQYEKAQQSFQQPLMDFAAETDQLWAALTAIRWVSHTGDYERVPEFIYSQCEKWKAREHEHPFVQQLCVQAARQNLPVLIGDPLPDFQLPMLNGDTLSLSRLLGDKLTILDLWASWCMPCRGENRDVLLPLWEQYHAKGLEIIGYALDASHKVWKRAIQGDGADRWQHASHLQGDNAPLFTALRITTIPANFIVDAKGTILAKNLHGDALTAFVENYLQENK